MKTMKILGMLILAGTLSVSAQKNEINVNKSVVTWTGNKIGGSHNGGIKIKTGYLEFKKGEFAGIVGPSGSGKTTLLNIIGSLDSPTEGKAIVMGKNISELSHKQSAQLRNLHLGFIFQVYNLLPVYTVFENVEFSSGN